MKNFQLLTSELPQVPRGVQEENQRQRPDGATRSSLRIRQRLDGGGHFQQKPRNYETTR